MNSLVVIIGVILVQLLSGCVWWMATPIGRRISVYELLGMGLALGTFASMMSSMLLARTPFVATGWLVPAALTLPLVWVLRHDGKLNLSRLKVPSRESWAVLSALAVGSIVLALNWVRLPLDAPTDTSFADLYFFEAIARGLAEFGPSQSVLMEGGALRYHWFTYAWSGELTEISQAAPFLVITRILPVTALFGVTVLAVSWAGRISRVRWVPTMAGLLIVAGGYSGALYGSILNFDSPSQSFTTMWLLAFATAFLIFIRLRTTLLFPSALLALLASALVGGKISHAIVAMGSVSIVTGALLLKGDPHWRRALSLTCVSGVSVLTTYLLVLSGVAVNRNLTEAIAVKASTWQGMDPSVGPLGVTLGTIVLLSAILARVAGMAWTVNVRALANDWWFALGGLVIGILAVAALSEGVNELWFILAASAPASVLSAVGMGSASAWLKKNKLTERRTLRFAISFVAIPPSIACLVLSRNWTRNQHLLNALAPVSIWALGILLSILVVKRMSNGHRTTRACAALMVCALPITSMLTRPASIWTVQRTVLTESGWLTPQTDTNLQSPPSYSLSPPKTDTQVMPTITYSMQLEAAKWLQANVPSDSILATSRPSSAIVPALSGHVMYIAGNKYQIGLGAMSDAKVAQSRSRESEQLASGPTSQALLELCKNGVEWIWLDGDAAKSWGEETSVAFENTAVKIVKIGAQECQEPK